MVNIELMSEEFNRISHSIKRINNFKQVASTFKWIAIFEKNFKAPHCANSLRDKLREVEL